MQDREADGVDHVFHLWFLVGEPEMGFRGVGLDDGLHKVRPHQRTGPPQLALYRAAEHEPTHFS